MTTISKLKQVFGEPDRTIPSTNGTALIWQGKTETVIVMIYRGKGKCSGVYVVKE